MAIESINFGLFNYVDRLSFHECNCADPREQSPLVRRFRRRKSLKIRESNEADSSNECCQELHESYLKYIVEIFSFITAAQIFVLQPLRILNPLVDFVVIVHSKSI